MLGEEDLFTFQVIVMGTIVLIFILLVCSVIFNIWLLFLSAIVISIIMFVVLMALMLGALYD